MDIIVSTETKIRNLAKIYIQFEEDWVEFFNFGRLQILQFNSQKIHLFLSKIFSFLSLSKSFSKNLVKYAKVLSYYFIMLFYI